VDGIITDDASDLKAIAGEPEFATTIRLAKRDDNPFQHANFGYGLHVHTADVWMGAPTQT
jgi:hypothetical protein